MTVISLSPPLSRSRTRCGSRSSL
uniref:Uncharacterized protein n=1 Tax=Arundo donax TaxID=35708 RepID=A0A0A9C1Z8_ARUDO